MRKKLLAALLAFAMVLTLLPATALAAGDGGKAYPAIGGNIYFDEATGAITGCDQSVTMAIIPSKINDVAVTGIGYAAFEGCSNLTSVTIPSGVTSIATYAFSNCNSLASVTIPQGVTSIGYGAFNGCSSLTSITIPNSVVRIQDLAFNQCSGLTSITIPSSVTSIGDYAFSACSSLTSVTIPSRVTSIGDYAFSACGSLTSVTIPSSVTSIGWAAFYRCSNLTDVYYSGSEGQWKRISVGDGNEPLLNATIHYNGVDIPEPEPEPEPDTSYWLFYHPNGGTGEKLGTQMYMAGEIVTVTSVVPVRAGYAFSGWYDGTTVYSAGQTFTMPECNVLLIAVWESTAIDLSSYLSSTATKNTGSTDGSFFFERNVDADDQNAFVQALVQFSLPEGTPDKDKEIIVEKLQKLLFESKYRPQVFGGDTAVIKNWYPQNIDPNSCRVKNRDNSEETWENKITWTNGASGCLSYGHFASAYVYGNKNNGNYNSPVQYSLTEDELTAYIEEHADPGETISYYYNGGHHAIVFLGENENRDGFYFVSYGGGKWYNEQTGQSGEYPNIDIGFFSYEAFSKVVRASCQVWDANNGSYSKGNAKPISYEESTSSIDAVSHCPVEMIVYANDEVLDSTGVEGTVSNQYVTMIATGTGDSRTISAHIDYDSDVDYRISLLGTDSGYMDVTVTYTDSDGTQDVRIFKNVPVEASMIANTSYLSARSTLELAVDYDDTDETQFWLANSNETSTAPDENYLTYNPGLGMENDPDSDSPGGGGGSSGGTTPSTPGTPGTGGETTKPETWTNPYNDVKDTDWFYDAVKYAAENALMDGVGNSQFAPNSTTNRAMLVTILYRLEGEPAVAANADFTDVDANQWYTKAVAWAAANGIVDGYGDGTFGPTKAITREQFATILYRYAQYKKLNTGNNANLSGYTDAASVSSWAADAMKWANSAGLITGFEDGSLKPAGDATRAQAATILMRLCEDVVK